MKKIAALLAIVALASCGSETSTTEVKSCDSTVCTDSTSVCADSTAVLVDTVEVETK